jgi:phage terminase large subunit-like protein
VQRWDTANKARELSDFIVCTTCRLKGNDLYLLHVLRKRMEYPELRRAVREQCQAFEASVVLIEDKASCTQLKRGHGMSFTAGSRCTGSIIRRPTAWEAVSTRITPNRSSAVCAGQKLAITMT